MPALFGVLVVLCLGVAPVAGATGSAEDDNWELENAFDDAPLEEAFKHPAWFRLSFLHLAEDLDEALGYGRKGLIVYFGQKHCPYCQKLIEGNFGKRDIEQYTRRNFDVVAIDIHGDRPVTNIKGEELTEKSFSEAEDTNFTPTLIFYVDGGREALRLRGYYPPYKFRAALEYVADGHYQSESFREYLERADPTAMDLAEDGMNEQDFFTPGPYQLDRQRFVAERPLAVFFEQGDCHSCDVLHSGPLSNEELRAMLDKMDAVQLNMWAETPVIRPNGVRTTSRQWADDLGLFYTPTLIFFDEQGQEIIRVDSVVHFYRMRRVLTYVMSGAYKQGMTMQKWARESGMKFNE